MIYVINMSIKFLFCVQDIVLKVVTIMEHVYLHTLVIVLLVGLVLIVTQVCMSLLLL